MVLLAGVGIVGLTGGILYGSLRAVGWIQQVPDLLRSPDGGVGPALRRGLAWLRERARRIGEPLEPEPPARSPSGRVGARRRYDRPPCPPSSASSRSPTRQ